MWDKLPREAQESILAKKLKFYVVDALAVAQQAGLAGRINTVTQACFFAISGILPREEAIAKIKEAIRKTYGKRGETVLNRNFAAVDASLAALREVPLPGRADSARTRRSAVARAAPDFVQRVTAMMLDGKGDLLPVSAMPVDGTFPTGTAQWEKRSIAHEIPIWDETICTQCAICPLTCPHAAIRMNVFPAEELKRAPAGFKAVPWARKDGGPLDDLMYSLQVAPDDCTGCGICVDVCPTRSKTEVKHKAVNMAPKLEHLEAERANYEFYLSLPEVRPALDSIDGLRGSQLRHAAVRVLGRVLGLRRDAVPEAAVAALRRPPGDGQCDRLLVDLRRQPADDALVAERRRPGPGLGQQPVRGQRRVRPRHAAGARCAARPGADAGARNCAPRSASRWPPNCSKRRRTTTSRSGSSASASSDLKAILPRLRTPEAGRLLAVADSLVVRSVWIVGGDGWAYDIGYGGLDHVLASGRNVNILVLDTEVYSNTGGQASKSTQRGAVAKFAAAGKAIGKKDLGMIAMAYGNVYVAQVAMGANPVQTVRTFQEAAAWNGPSLIIAYSHCIAHGIDMTTGMSHQRDLVKSGYLTLYHYDPRLGMGGADQPLKLDSRKPTLPLEQVAMKEGRYAMLAQSDPARSKQLMKAAQHDADARWQLYEQVAGVHRVVTEEGGRARAARRAGATTHRGAFAGEHIMSVDLRTRYLGLELQHPIVASASPLTSSIDSLKRLQAAGVAAVVLPSLFEEQIEHDEMATHNLMMHGAELSPEAHGFFPEMQSYRTGPDEYLKLIADAKKALSVPVIASLNGHTAGRLDHHRAPDPGRRRRRDRAQRVLPRRQRRRHQRRGRAALCRPGRSVTRQVSIPVAVKVAPYFSAMANMAARLTKAGASGLVLFNRFLQPDIELEELEVSPHLVLSTSDELRLALRWIAILRGRVDASLAATGGAHTPDDVLKLLLAGADCVMLASCLLTHGPSHVGTLVRGVQAWMAEREYTSVAQMKGSLSQQSCPDPDAFERANYMKALTVLHQRVRVEFRRGSSLAPQSQPGGDHDGTSDQRRLHRMRRLRVAVPERSDQCRLPDLRHRSRPSAPNASARTTSRSASRCARPTASFPTRSTWKRRISCRPSTTACTAEAVGARALPTARRCRARRPGGSPAWCPCGRARAGSAGRGACRQSGGRDESGPTRAPCGRWPLRPCRSRPGRHDRSRNAESRATAPPHRFRH